MSTFSTVVNVLLRRTLLWFVIRAAEWRTIHGIRVGVLVPAYMNPEDCFRRLENALSIIDVVVPYRKTRMARDIAGLLCCGTGRGNAVGAYAPAFGMCIIDPRHVLNNASASSDIARTILHEATHCRLHRAGVQRWTRRIERIEEICIRAEQDFIAKYQLRQSG